MVSCKIGVFIWTSSTLKKDGGGEGRLISDAKSSIARRLTS